MSVEQSIKLTTEQLISIFDLPDTDLDFVQKLNNICIDSFNTDPDTILPILNDKRIDLTHNDNYIFRQAIELNNLKIIQILLKHTNPSFDQNYAIQRACRLGLDQIVKLLIDDYRVDPGSSDNICLEYATEHNHVKVVEILCKSPKVNPTANNYSAFCLACRKGHDQIVSILIGISVAQITNNYPIRWAATNGHAKTIKILLDNNYDPNVNSNYPFRIAATNGHTDAVKALLQYPRVNPSANSNEAIKNAASNKHYGIVRLILKDNRFVSKDNCFENIICSIGNPDLLHDFSYLCTNYPLLLQLASTHCQTKIVSWLLTNVPKLNIDTSLRLACLNNHAKIVKLFIQTNKYTVNDYFKMNLTIAIDKSYTEIVAILLKLFVNPVLSINKDISAEIFELILPKCTKFNTLFKFFIVNQREDLCVKLFDRIDVDYQDNLFIQLASEHRSTVIVGKLLANPKVRPDANNNYAIKMSIQNNDVEITKLLIDLVQISPLDKYLIDFSKINVKMFELIHEKLHLKPTKIFLQATNQDLIIFLLKTRLVSSKIITGSYINRLYDRLKLNDFIAIAKLIDWSQIDMWIIDSKPKELIKQIIKSKPIDLDRGLADDFWAECGRKLKNPNLVYAVFPIEQIVDGPIDDNIRAFKKTQTHVFVVSVSKLEKITVPAEHSEVITYDGKIKCKLT